MEFKIPLFTFLFFFLRLFAESFSEVVRPDEESKKTFFKRKPKIPNGKKPADGPERPEHILMSYDYIAHGCIISKAGSSGNNMR